MDGKTSFSLKKEPLLYFDYQEDKNGRVGGIWHFDLERLPENNGWKNIGIGHKPVLEHFCGMINILNREFGKKLTSEQVIRLAECTPGIKVFNPTEMPEHYDDQERHRMPLDCRESLEKYWESHGK